MGQEIERKFLVKNDDWKKFVSEQYAITQGYLNSDPERVVRVRIRDDKGILTIKSKTIGISRQEFEYEIPISDANALIDLCEKPLIEKVRNIIVFEAKKWEVDVFYGENKGLVVAEIELDFAEEQINLPDWIGKEVSQDPKYYNANLFKNPIKKAL